MAGTRVDVDTRPDGTVVIQPHGRLGTEDATELRHLLVQTIRHDRPARLTIDLADVTRLDPISLGTIAAACHLGDDQRVAVELANVTADVATQLFAADVAPERIRPQVSAVLPRPRPGD
ncbi:STAS domain-containing protein [Actinoplanes bogorensis]|uniref:STAS domain-containing protein n=1 Tax=Paractinoplanes bogorensis TaxID=1610840 RepID=A0ABS5YX48_9ACTN|nr:STAS domain-containing protein [Actinoplanes bogorensis]MBU2668015.1 STAS domain-containing protein [Actinoplanes bogorensis]